MRGVSSLDSLDSLDSESAEYMDERGELILEAITGWIGSSMGEAYRKEA
jgi:hypothetical protein